MKPTKKYITLIMFIVCGAVAVDLPGDPDSCKRVLSAIFKLNEPGKTVELCYKQAFYELIKESVKVENVFSQEEMGSSKEEYGQLYMDYLYDQVDKKKVPTHLIFCTILAKGRNNLHGECLVTLYEAKMHYRNGCAVFNDMLNRKKKADYPQGSIPFMYFEYVYKAATLAPNTLSPNDWCTDLMYLTTNRPFNRKQREKRKSLREESSSGKLPRRDSSNSTLKF